MSQILLVRHGQASWGSDDYDVLSPLGEKQSPCAFLEHGRERIFPRFWPAKLTPAVA